MKNSQKSFCDFIGRIRSDRTKKEAAVATLRDADEPRPHPIGKSVEITFINTPPPRKFPPLDKI